jgi:drug/metabolite transporter (DMT)-like permease
MDITLMKMSLFDTLGLLSFAFIMATGQILFKRTAEQAPTLKSAQDSIVLLTLPSFWLAGLLYAAATLLWIKLLQTVPLSRAYPFAALGFVVVPIAALLFFKETLTLRYAIGAALIVTGIAITSQS